MDQELLLWLCSSTDPPAPSASPSAPASWRCRGWSPATSTTRRWTWVSWSQTWSAETPCPGSGSGRPWWWWSVYHSTDDCSLYFYHFTSLIIFVWNINIQDFINECMMCVENINSKIAFIFWTFLTVLKFKIMVNNWTPSQQVTYLKH